MVKIRKSTKTISSLGILLVGVIILGVAFFAKSRPITELETKMQTLDSLPECGTYNAKPPIKAATWKTFVDKHGKVKISLPDDFKIVKGSLDYLSDLDYLDEVKENPVSFKYEFYLQYPNGIATLGISLNSEECDTTESCFQKLTTSLPIYSDLCKAYRSNDTKELLLIRSTQKVEPATVWSTYMQTDRGIMHIFLAESGRTDYDFDDAILSIIDSIEFTQ